MFLKSLALHCSASAAASRTVGGSAGMRAARHVLGASDIVGGGGPVLTLVRGKKTKATGATRNKKSPRGRRMGIKAKTGARVDVGHILVRQHGRKYHPGEGVVCGREYTLTATKPGFVVFTKELNPKFDPKRLWYKKRHLKRIHVVPEHPQNPHLHIGMEQRNLYADNKQVAQLVSEQFEHLYEATEEDDDGEVLLYVPKEHYNVKQVNEKLKGVNKKLREMGIPRTKFFAFAPKTGGGAIDLDCIQIRHSAYYA